MGCGLAYEGGRCQMQRDIENCLYENEEAVGIKGCHGAL